MIQLRLRTEFTFGEKVYGKIDDVVARLAEIGASAAAITDTTAFGHVAFHAACSKAGIKPLLGAAIRFDGKRMTLIARNNAGLRELYRLMSRGSELAAQDISDSTGDVIKLIGTATDKAFIKTLTNAYADITPRDHELNKSKLKLKLPVVMASDNFYMRAADRPTFELFGGDARIDPMNPQHIITEAEARALFRYAPVVSALSNMQKVADECVVNLPRAENVKMAGDLEQLCRDGITARGLQWSGEYEARLKREMQIIRQKGFTDYLLVLSDLIRYAKTKMLVGPARGSSAGSLVCFLAFITDIDPIKHGLIFERFIDINRSDLPDVDVDFPDEKREMVIEYLREKYGAEKVAHIGTTQTWQPKSIIAEVSNRMNIPKWELDPLRAVLIERNDGDARASLCLLDTLTTVEAGMNALKKYPVLKRATAFEGHAKHSGTHAAGVIICNDPVVNYCALNDEGVAHIDKKDAEKINILKVDLLGLRTLSIIEEVQRDMSNVPLNDPLAFEELNAARFAGIFQFEGDAVQKFARGMKIETFDDIVALVALARPGPMNSGSAQQYVDRRSGKESVTHLHRRTKTICADTMGLIIYQEQVMMIAREVGKMEWSDVTDLRRAMGKSLGEEHFESFWQKFLTGSKLKEVEARSIWNNMRTMGAYAFNKSHAVAYGLLSYWCAWLKAHHRLEFTAATLRHAKDDAQVIALLREHGEKYVAFDAQKSAMNWTVQDGVLIGGFLNIKGVGEVKAAALLAERAEGAFSERSRAFLDSAEVMFTDPNPARTKFGAIYDDPRAAGFRLPKVSHIAELDGQDSFAFIGILRRKTPRDLNEYTFQVKRQQEGKNAIITGRPTQYLNLRLEDDTGGTNATINAQDFEGTGRDIVDNGVVDKSWYIVQGRRNRNGNINIIWMKELK